MHLLHLDHAVWFEMTKETAFFMFLFIYPHDLAVLLFFSFSCSLHHIHQIYLHHISCLNFLILGGIFLAHCLYNSALLSLFSSHLLHLLPARSSLLSLLHPPSFVFILHPRFRTEPLKSQRRWIWKPQILTLLMIIMNISFICWNRSLQSWPPKMIVLL